MAWSAELRAGIDFAFEQLERSGDDVSRLALPVRTIVVIVSAQGVIDNGGLHYFFESDFPGCPAYETFVDAYLEIGAVEAARALAEAVALFPFGEPHKAIAARNEFMDSFDDEARKRFR